MEDFSSKLFTAPPRWTIRYAQLTVSSVYPSQYLLHCLHYHPAPAGPTTLNDPLASYDASMASIETLDLSDNPSKADGENGVQQGTLVQGSPTKGVDEAASLPKPDGPQADSLSASPSPASSSTPLRGAVPNGQPAPGTTNAPTLSMPHPKKFSSVNINKKFLERSSSSTGNVQTASTSLSSKVGSTARAF